MTYWLTVFLTEYCVVWMYHSLLTLPLLEDVSVVLVILVNSYKDSYVGFV